MESLQTLWRRNSAQWPLLASPVRPCAEDIALYQQALERWRAGRGEPRHRILLLGVTPELRGMSWPADAELASCDHTRAMIDTLWSHAAFPGAWSAPVCADWRAMPFPDTTRDIALGDGWASMLGPDPLRRALGELHRVLVPGGLLATRLYLFPRSGETPEHVAAAAHAGRIGSFHAFKWRLAMAVQGDTDRGVRLADIWDAFAALCPDREILSSRAGWSLATIGTIDTYRGAQGRYYYHRLETYAGWLQSGFELVSVDYPGYELGERCPVIAARRR
jgi:SAM-dependent methyltransferase